MGFNHQLQTEEEFQALLWWRSQNEVRRQKPNDPLRWRRIQRQQVRGQLRWMHRRWRQQFPPPQQQYYRWRHQQPIMISQLQNMANLKRQNSTNQRNAERVSIQSQQTQVEDLNNELQQDKFNFSQTSRTLNGSSGGGQQAQNKNNSVLVDNQSTQKLETFDGKLQNQGNQLDNRMANIEKQNKVPNLTTIRNYQDDPPRPFETKKQKIENRDQELKLSSSQSPKTEPQLPMPQISVRNEEQPKASTPSEAEESASSSESYWKNSELYPMWKPPFGLGILPVRDQHAAKERNVLLKRVKPPVQSSSKLRSNKQTPDNSNVQQQTWIFGFLSYKKISGTNDKIKIPNQFESISQPVSSYQQNNSILQGPSNEQQKRKEKLYENYPKDRTKLYQTGNNISLKNTPPVTKSYGSPITWSSIRLISPPNSTTQSKNSDSTSEPPIMVKSYTIDISAHIDEELILKNAEVESDKPEVYKSPANSQSHLAGLKTEPSQSSQVSNIELEKTEKSYPSVFTNSNTLTNPLLTVLKIPQVEEKNVSQKSYSNPQVTQKEMSSTFSNSTPNQSTFPAGNQLGKNHRLFESSDRTNILKKRTIDGRGNSPKETDNQRLSNMESFGGPINIDPYHRSSQNKYPSKSSVDLELSSNEVEYLFQAVRSGMKLLMNKIMGATR